MGQNYSFGTIYRDRVPYFKWQLFVHAVTTLVAVLTTPDNLTNDQQLLNVRSTSRTRQDPAWSYLHYSHI